MKTNVSKQRFGAVIASGAIGIVDAETVRVLENIKEGTGLLLAYVSRSIYREIIPVNHIAEFLSSLSIVDGVLPDETEVERMVEEDGAALFPFPEEALRRYSYDRINNAGCDEDGENECLTAKIVAPEELPNLFGGSPGKRKITIGLVSGSFDLIHPGHVRYINSSKARADVVIAAAMSADSIRKQEKNVNNDRPVYSGADRMKVLSSLKNVDHIVVFDDIDCKRTIEIIRPDYFFKHEKDLSRRVVKEECNLVERLGGRVIVTKDTADYSSTRIIRHVRKTGVVK